jgi:hypothetical protein
VAVTIASVAQSIVSVLAAAIRRALSCQAACVAAILLMAVASPFFLCDRQASAADPSPQPRVWVVGELRGAAFSRPGGADDAQWQPLQLGAEIVPGTVVRTDASGSMELRNGIDTIRLSPSSEIELPAGQDGDPVTRVIHWIGTAFFHVGKRPGPQFEVDTPYIVAIVKGTKFTTSVSEAGASIKVSEGIVGVSATAGGSSIDVTAGGSASVSAAHSHTVTPGGASGAADPAGPGGGYALARSEGETSAATDAEAGAVSSAGDAFSGGPDDPAEGDNAGTNKVGRGSGGGNGNGRGRDDQSEGNTAVIGNGSGQDSVDSGGDGDGDHGRGCHGHEGHHDEGDHHDHERDHHDHDGRRH